MKRLIQFILSAIGLFFLFVFILFLINRNSVNALSISLMAVLAGLISWRIDGINEEET